MVKQMKAEVYLRSYEHLYRQAERLTQEINELDALAKAGGGAIRYDQDKVKSSPGNGVMTVVEKKVSLEMVLKDTINEMIALKHDMQEIFSHLVNRDRRIAELTWFEFEGSIYISQVLRCSVRTVFRRRYMILQYVQEMLDMSVLT